MDKNLGELYQNLKQCFALLTTDITGDECTSYLEKFLNMKKAEFSYFRIPAEGSYTTSIILNFHSISPSGPAPGRAFSISSALLRYYSSVPSPQHA